MVNQIQFHPFIFNKQKELLAFCKERNIQVEAYSPLSHLMPMVGPELRHIAKQLGKSPSQAVLRWCLQHGPVPLPRSTNPDHIRENLDIFDFELSDDQMQAIDRLSE
jgi:diketogulonate reductase-like aldo/keto reductase